MRNDECIRFEQLLASQAEPDESLAQHILHCLHCSALAGIAALSAPPVPAHEGDPLTDSLQAIAAGIAQKRAARRERRRRLVPFLIGLAGYLTACLTLSAALLSHGSGGHATAQPGEFWLPALPPPQPAALAAAFAAAAVWIAAVALLTRSRRAVLGPNTRAPEP